MQTANKTKLCLIFGSFCRAYVRFCCPCCMWIFWLWSEVFVLFSDTIMMVVFKFFSSFVIHWKVIFTTMKACWQAGSISAFFCPLSSYLTLIFFLTTAYPFQISITSWKPFFVVFLMYLLSKAILSLLSKAMRNAKQSCSFKIIAYLGTTVSLGFLILVCPYFCNWLFPCLLVPTASLHAE